MLPLRVLSSAEAAHGGFFVVDERGERLRPSPTAMAEAEYSAISALQHWSYCPRQCALIHVDQAFADNLHTARGNAVHALVDQPGLPLRMERERIETTAALTARVLGGRQHRGTG